MSSALKMCPTCGTEYPANERFCPRDGTALRSVGGESSDLVGSIIAERYHVLKKLGEGGMGQVYLAEHVKMGRKSAVKVMNPGMVHDGDAISRFNREAANASRINHPNVAGIYDFGETPEGLIYLAMEFIEGQSLTALVESAGALPAMRAADITKQAADGLQVAHDMGIVHRDLKPDNIMIAKNRDGSDLVKVVDFGIAKAAGSDAQKVTKTGLVVGTPEYMSPEQLAGDKLDGRSDVYSLALVAFNMLTGKLPFPSETVQESMIMRLTDRPKSLVDMAPTTAWPEDVQQVMDKALERDAKLRYQSAGEFGRALWLAVERMPASATSAAGTMVMSSAAAGAAGGAPTAAIPATRVASAADRTPSGGGAAVAVPGKSKAPLLVGAGAIAVAAVVAGVLFMGKGASTSGASAAPAPTVSTSATATPAGGVVAPAGSPAVGAPAKPAGTAPAAAGRTAASTPASSAGAAGPDIGKRLPALLSMSAEDATAPKALSEAQELAPRATRQQDLVGLAVVRAQALGMLGREAESCTVLHSVESTAGATPYGATVVRLLGSC